MSFLLDTNVLIERGRSHPNPRVVAWFNAQPPAEIYLCPVVVAEYLTGLFRLPAGRGRINAAVYLRGALQTFPWAELDRRVAACFGLIRARVIRARIRHNDLWLGAAALAHGLTVATRNVHDFQAQGVPHFNPF